MDEPLKTEEKRNPDGTFALGTAPGPGRPRGKTIKERVREWLEEHPDDMASFVKHFVLENRELGWQMLEGRPPQDVDLKSGGEKIVFPIYAGKALSGHTGDKENIPAPETNTGS